MDHLVCIYAMQGRYCRQHWSKTWSVRCPNFTVSKFLCKSTLTASMKVILLYIMLPREHIYNYITGLCALDCYKCTHMNIPVVYMGFIHNSHSCNTALSNCIELCWQVLNHSTDYVNIPGCRDLNAHSCNTALSNCIELCWHVLNHSTDYVNIPGCRGLNAH